MDASSSSTATAWASVAADDRSQRERGSAAREGARQRFTLRDVLSVRVWGGWRPLGSEGASVGDSLAL
jgi:hypothetical protein